MRAKPRPPADSLARPHGPRRHGVPRKPLTPPAASDQLRAQLEKIRGVVGMPPEVRAKADDLLAAISAAETAPKKPPPHEDRALKLTDEQRATLAGLYAAAEAGSEKARRSYWNRIEWHSGDRSKWLGVRR